MTIAEQKAAQRKAGIAARRALSEADRTSANAALCARIAGLDCFRTAVSYTHLRAHETDSYLVFRLLLENKQSLAINIYILWLD